MKYRVPFRDPANRGLAGVQDAQRAISLTRSKATEWRLDPKRIGVLGFSAGGHIAGHSVFRQHERHYTRLDAVDDVPCGPDFLVMVYGAGFAEKESGRLRADLKLAAPPPPAFIVHAWDDGVDVRNPLELAAEWKRAGGSAEVHVFPTGGHGYGLRPVEGQPVTAWADLCAAWMKRTGLLAPRH